MSKQSFADLGVSTPVAAALDERGIREPFAVQELVIPDALAGRDVLATSPTGSGKTLAFGLPLIERIEATDRRAAALVLAPTRELASQIFDDLEPLARSRALAIAAVYGGVGITAQAKRARKAHILIATPGRLLDLIGRGDVSLDAVKTLVLDECDRMLDMGFRPDVDRIVDRTPADRQTLFFSATLDGAAGDAARAYTRDARRHSHSPPDSTRMVEHRFVAVEHADKLDRLVAELRSDDRDLALVFVRTKRGADRLVKRLSRHGLDSVAIHGNRSQGQRERALASFERGQIPTLVATDVAARGIDVSGISHVINFDPPDDHDTYTHRVGRTARAGASGIGVTFVGSDQAHEVRQIATKLKLVQQFSEAGLGSGRRGDSGHSGAGGRRNRSGGRSNGSGRANGSNRSNGSGRSKSGGHPNGSGRSARGGRGRGGHGRRSGEGSGRSRSQGRS